MNNIPQNTAERIEFNFTCYALKLLGHNLYSNPWTAVSEIVANGIDAKASNIYILVDLFNKESAQIEVLDDGYGMTYQDLCDKYTIIGRNKRIDNPEDKSILGRKGVGKLAALYLSDNYYLFTKNSNEKSAWQVDLRNAKDNDIPALETYSGSEIINSAEKWKALSSGTLIKLTDVDLKKVGPERLKALPVMLSDYYLSDIISCKINVCVRYSEQQEIVFLPIQKRISYETMYEIFDNTKHGYQDKLKDAIYLTTKEEVPKELDVPVKTIRMDSFAGTKGDIVVKNIYGEEIKAQYELKGWIGIHGSLRSEIQQRNNPDFGKIQYHPNAIRLYVRGKLAVDNLLTYINSNQAFANYIEGEISFDILDDDRFEDISTSSREGYKKDDIRVVTLLNIVGGIVRKFVSDRATVGTCINIQVKEYWAEKEREEAKRRQEEVKARENAEKEKQEAENKLGIMRKDKEKAEQRLFVLENNFVGSGERYKQAVHLAVNYAKGIRGIVCDFDVDKVNDLDYVKRELMGVDLVAEKIESLPIFTDVATFPLVTPKITTDIMKLIKEYVEAKGSPRLKYSFDIGSTVSREIEFPEILIFVENVISNSIKAAAMKMHISSLEIGSKLQIDFSDDGKGLDKKYRDNPQAIFNLGETTTVGGFGIGTFHMKEIVEKLGGTILAIQNEGKGLTIRVLI